MWIVKMWGTSMIFVVFGVLGLVRSVGSQPRVIERRTEPSLDRANTLKEDIQTVIGQIHSLSGGSARSSSPSAQGFTLNSYYDVLNNVYAIFRPLLGERFLGDLPGTLVCILSGRQDCGIEAELTKVVSLELVQPLLTFMTTLRSQTCSAVTEESFLRAYFRAGGTETIFPQKIVDLLSSFPLSETLLSRMGGALDSTVASVLQFTASLLQVPMDYVKIALQFGVKIPSLDGIETCEQGDLKQLIMWGINNDIHWSFSKSLMNLLLENLLGQNMCPHPGPECQNPQVFSLQRSFTEKDDSHYHDYLFQCDRKNLAELNETLCPKVLSGSSAAPPVASLCRALASLSRGQLETFWSNLCFVVQALMSPLVTKSNCTGTVAFVPVGPPPVMMARSSVRRRSRDTSSLSQLACNYNDWIVNSADPVLVSLCSDNEREGFVTQVCQNAQLMKRLLLDQANSWLYAYCGNLTTDLKYLVSEFCAYETWMDRPAEMVGPLLLDFCLTADGPKLKTLICEYTGFFMLLFSNPQNLHLMPNCTTFPTAPPAINVDLMLESCDYSKWRDGMQITTENLIHCIRYDAARFTEVVCLNLTFMNTLLQNRQNSWLSEHCSGVINDQPTEVPQHFVIAQWCDYHTWGGREVDDSVVGLCWQHDQQAFQKKVCCEALVFERLVRNPLNKWLETACKEVKDIHEMLQVCRYSDWTKPIIVDMTVLALCAEVDPKNFTTLVCANETVLQNLLANQDNTWLIQHCANLTSVKVPPEGGGGGGGGSQGGGTPGFNPAEQCQYSSWSISHPDVTLLTLCWEHDQVNFMSSVCPDKRLLSRLLSEPSSMWVSTMCAIYTNYTRTNHTSESPSCPLLTLVKQMNSTCAAADFQTICAPGPDQTLVVQRMIRCLGDGLWSRVGQLLSPSVATVLDQAVSTSVILMLAVERVQNITLHISENIRLNVLDAVHQYMQRESSFDRKRVVLQCFGRVLTSLMQTSRGATTDDFRIIEEYFKIPLEDLKEVLSDSHVSTVRLILQYYSRNKATLQLPEAYISTMVAVLFQTHVVKDGNLFSELAPFLESASPADIYALPSLPNFNVVRETINRNLWQMSLDQRQAFGLWYSKAMPLSDITEGHQSIIRDIGNIIAFLPFHNNFQHLSPAQLLDGLDVLQSNTLTPLQQEFISQSIVGTYKNLTDGDFTRLGTLTCLADPRDLEVYRGTESFGLISDILMNCTRDGSNLPSSLTSEMLMDDEQLRIPSLLSPQQLSEISHLLPSLGLTFLEGLTSSQLNSALNTLRSVSFSPAQAFAITKKLSSIYPLNVAGRLRGLGALVSGVKTESLLTLTSDWLLLSLPDMAEHGLCSSRPQANAITTKLWGFPEVVDWLDDVELLLDCTPLLSVSSRIPLLEEEISVARTKPWNTQQAKAIFNQLEREQTLSRMGSSQTLDFLSLGTVLQGVSCTVLQERLRSDPTPSAVRRVLALLRQQPRPLHTSLKKCVVEELYHFEFFPELLGDLGAEIALSMPVSTIKKFTPDMMDTFRRLILDFPHQFWIQSRTKKELLVDKMVQRMDMYTGVFTKEEFLSLGVMATFVVDQVFVQLDREFFVNNLESLQQLCYTSNKMDIMAKMLQEEATFGPVQKWNSTTLTEVGRMLFFLSEEKLREISMDLMTVARVERLFMSQRRWEDGHVGRHCLDVSDRRRFSQKQQFVLQYFLGFLRMTPGSPPPMVPTCQILHTTAPFAWTSHSLTSMLPSAFYDCLELMGLDPFLESYQRSQILQRVKEIFGPVSSFSQSLISQLGGLAVEISAEEMRSLKLTERRSIASLGVISSLNQDQLTTLFNVIKNSMNLSPTQFDSSLLVSMGYILCGAETVELETLNPVEFSKAVQWLGQLRLACSEKQLEALVGLLIHKLAFGPVSSWGADVFIEIGVLAAGLPDMSMSALVRDQIEGLTPLAISMIPADKFAVVFNGKQITMFSYEQAVAVTAEQFSALTEVQKKGLAMVLTPWEDRHLNLRGKSPGVAVRPSLLCLTLCLLTLLLVKPHNSPAHPGL